MSIQIEREVQDYVVALAAAQGRADGLTQDTPLFQTGIIDSFALLDLVSFLEQRFEIAVADEDVIPRHFDSVATIARFVRSKRP